MKQEANVQVLNPAVPLQPSRSSFTLFTVTHQESAPPNTSCSCLRQSSPLTASDSEVLIFIPSVSHLAVIQSGGHTFTGSIDLWSPFHGAAQESLKKKQNVVKPSSVILIPLMSPSHLLLFLSVTALTLTGIVEILLLFIVWYSHNGLSAHPNRGADVL